MSITVFQAQRVIAANRSRPGATPIAVREEHIAGAGHVIRAR